jgi:hypothetical protein
MNQIEEYVRKNYKLRFGDKPLTITEYRNHYQIKTNKDESPLILSKTI